jgi:hypothetical protein
MNEWNYASVPPYVCIVSGLVKHQGQFYLFNRLMIYINEIHIQVFQCCKKLNAYNERIMIKKI